MKSLLLVLLSLFFKQSLVDALSEEEQKKLGVEFASDITQEELEFVLSLLNKFKPRDGVPLKVTEKSRLMEFRNELISSTSDIFIVDVDQFNEGDLIKLAQRNIRVPFNVGRVGGHKNISAVLSDVACKKALKFDCDPSDKFRTITGICNNLKNDVLWGSASSRMRRFIPAQYADGLRIPRGGYDSAESHCKTGGNNQINFCPCTSNPGALLPNPRHVSKNFHFEKNVPDYTTHMFTQFGQFLDHDITLTPETHTGACCFGSQHKECFPIFAPCDDSFQPLLDVSPKECGSGSSYSGGADGNNEKCLHFSRSLEFCQECIAKPRDQMNGITAFIDASNVYGSSEELSDYLREGPFLKVSDNNLLPILHSLNPTEDENEVPPEETAGDGRAREMPGLAAMHTIFVREHNRIVKELIYNCGENNFQDLYQEARRIVGAQMQNIVYDQYLTTLLGQETMITEGLALSIYDQYNPDTDPSIRNAFATSAFRFGHSMIQDLIAMYLTNSNGIIDEKLYNLRDHFFNMENYHYDNGLGMEYIIMGLIVQASQKNDIHVENDLTKHLFAREDDNCIGGDLVARNIQRGRDHGLPGYNDFREFCGMERICSWEKVPEEIGVEAWKHLYELYDNPSDIDLFTAGLAEKPFQGGVVGRTFNCLISKQFKKLKEGDRFFFTGKANPNPFELDQLEILRQRHLGDIICDNTKLPFVKRNVFMMKSDEMRCGEHFKLETKAFC